MVRRADRSVEGEAWSLLDSLGNIWGWLVALIAFLIIIPLFIWSIFKFDKGATNAIAVTLFCISFGWGMVSLLKLNRAMSRLGSGVAALAAVSGARPTDPDEFLVWKWGWNFVISCIAVMLTMLLIPLVS